MYVNVLEEVKIIYNMNLEDGLHISVDYDEESVLRTESSNNIIYDDDVFS